MNKNKFLFRFISVLSCGLIMSTTSLAASYTDTERHWADNAIERWTGYKIIEGYGNGLFKPDSNMTRAELAQVVNKLLELKNKNGTEFKDVDTKAWFYDAVSACNNAGITNGVGDNQFNPDAPITRQEAMVMLGRALDVIPDTEIKLDAFKDAEEISDWAEGIISSMVSRKIVQGAGNENLSPKENVTRAEVLEMINKTISTYIVKDGEYEITENDEGKIILSVAKEVTIKGDLKSDIIIAQGSDDGEIILDGVKTGGEIYISADGATIRLKNRSEVGNVCVIGNNDKIIVDKNAKAEKIEVRAENTEVKGDGEVLMVEVMDGAKDTTIETSKTEVKTSENSENTVAKGKDVKPGDSTVTPSDSNHSSSTTKYTVTFDANGGVNVSENEVKVEEGNKVAMPENPTREGYIFDGWYLADEQYNFESSVNQDITLKAMWKFEIKDQASLETYALGKYEDKDIVESAVVTADITLESGIVINRALEIDFDNHSITMNKDISEELEGAKYVIYITAKEEVKLSNLVVDSASKARGIQAYMSKVILENVTVKNSIREGLLVNGAMVTARNLNASGNTFGSVDIDKGENVPEETETVFTLEGNGVLEDRIKIWSELATKDVSASDIVKAEGLSVAKIELNSVEVFVWDEEAQLEEIMKEEGYLALIEKDGVKVGYKTLQDAFANAKDGDTVKLLNDINL